MPQKYGVVQAAMVGATPEQVRDWVERILWWAALGAGIFGPARGVIVAFLTPILTSDEFCEKLARLLSKVNVGDKVTYSDLEKA